MNKDIQAFILNETGKREIVEVEVIQSLWSGYGELSKLKFDDSSVIVKNINLENSEVHPRGWKSNFGHERKKFSYQVERNWYKNYNTPILGSVLPRLISCIEKENYQFLILEDLSEKGFQSKTEVNANEIKLCLSWLAHFHKTHLSSKPDGLWEVGTYWHLETRPDELEVLNDEELKSAAIEIDMKLNSAKFRTIVHGDAKLANFLFNDKVAAAVDFQYVGGGVGVKDVALFFSSVYDENELEQYSSDMLDYYFRVLNEPDVEVEWRKLYPLAWCDYFRFLKGWSSEHHRINKFSIAMKDKALKCL